MPFTAFTVLNDFQTLLTSITFSFIKDFKLFLVINKAYCPMVKPEFKFNENVLGEINKPDFSGPKDVMKILTFIWKISNFKRKK